MNLKKEVEELRELNVEANERCNDKDRLLEELQDKIHELIREI
jgi:hypothetical protein